MDVIEIFLKQQGASEEDIHRIKRRFEAHPDLLAELEGAIALDKYPISSRAICVEGYTADDIFHAAPFMDYIGAYSFLVMLRENPEKTKRIIRSGFSKM
jgi:hypothetical protein